MYTDAEDRLTDAAEVADGIRPGWDISADEEEPEEMPFAARWLPTAFLCGSPASYGLLTDAMPAATRHLLIAANGFASAGGVSMPLYTACEGGTEELMRETFPMLRPGGVREDILRMTFGDCTRQREHPLARFCAALAEAVGTDYLIAAEEGDGYVETFRRDGNGTDAFPDVCRELGLRLSEELGRLQSNLTDRDSAGGARRRRGLPAVSPEYFEVSFCACRVKPGEEDGDYTLELFSAGDLNVFLLDGEGLFPLWTQRTERVSPETGDAMAGRRLVLRHPEPCALLLLSDSVCAPFRPDTEEDGIVPVRDRLRLEERLLRIVLASGSEQELGARAAQGLADFAAGEASASGAMTVLTGAGSGYEDFRDVCVARLRVLEQDAALLPDGYDPRPRTEGMTCAEAERHFVRDLLANRPDLRDRTVGVLEELVQERLRGLSQKEDETQSSFREEVLAPPPEGSDDPIRGLALCDVYRELRRFDAVNDLPRRQIDRSCCLMRAFLAEHWITLRPLLCAPGAPGRADVPEEDAARADRQYHCCVDLNRRLEQILRARRAGLADLRTLLADSLARVQWEGESWALGRGDAADCPDFLDAVSGTLPALLKTVGAAWGHGGTPDAGHFGSLQTAYTAEREKLFDRDAAPGGVFSALWLSLKEGTVPEETFRTCRAAAVAGAGEAFGAAMDMLAALSAGIGQLREQIAARGAERQCIRAIADSFDWQFACLRGAVYGSDEAGWRGVTDGLVDGATATAYRRVVREWHETRALDERRRSTYAAYRDAWGRYLRS